MDEAGMDAGQRRNPAEVVFEPARLATRQRLAWAFVLGALVWLVAGVLAVIMLGESYILRTLLLAVVASWVFFTAMLLGAMALRRRDEHNPAPDRNPAPNRDRKPGP
jgi:hypothetical protein